MRENLINLGGWSNKKKGYTLIEMIVVIAISAIAMGIGITLIMNSYKNYMNIRKETIKADELDNVLLTIDRLLTENMIKSINYNTTSNEIKIDYLIEHGKDSIKSKVIRRDVETLIVESLDGIEVKNKRVILKKVEKFEVISKQKLYYYKITLKNGEDIIRCI